MDRMLNAVIAKIENSAGKFTEQGITPPQVIDFYAGQPDQPDQFEFVLPALFLDYSADYNNGILYVYLHALYDFTPDTENIALNRENSFKHLKYYSLLKQLLRNTSAKPVFGNLRLYQDDPVSNDNFHYHRITFACPMFDDLDTLYNKYIDLEDTVTTLGKGKIKACL